MTVWRAIMLVLVSAAVAAFGLAWPQTRDKLWALCRGTDSHRAIAGCTALIEARQEGAATVADAFYSRGLAYETVGRAERGHDLALALFDRAIADADHAIDLKPDFVDAFILRGAIHVDKGAYDRAIADFDRALALKPDHAVAFISRGQVHQDKGDYVQAIADYDQAIRLKPRDADIYSRRAYSYWGKGDLERAIHDLDQAILLEPSNAGLWSRRCLVRAETREFPQAIADCDQSLRLDPGGSPTVRGFVRLKMRNAALALADFEAALKADPQTADGLYGRGLAKRLKGDEAGASADIAAAERSNPDIVSNYAKFLE